MTTAKPLVQEKCIFCGKPTANRKHILNPRAKHELPACSAECLNESKAFLKQDTKFRKVFYLLEFAFILANLTLFAMNLLNRWSFVPLLGMGAVLYFFPMPFTRYESYQRLGIKKTVKVVRIVSVFLVLFSVLLIVVYK
jgi:hypothetical protein